MPGWALDHTALLAFAMLAGLLMAIPPPVSSDPEAVRDALLEAARAKAAGQPAASLGALRRAAGICAEAGDDRRAVVLFDAAAELANELSPAGAGGAKIAPEVDARRAAQPPPLPQAARPVPSPQVSPKRTKGDEAVKTTAVTPRTRLRRAMLAIDPEYADRVDYDPSQLQGRGAVEALIRSASATSPDIGYVTHDGAPAEQHRREWDLAGDQGDGAADGDAVPSPAAPPGAGGSAVAGTSAAGAEIEGARAVFQVQLVPIVDEGEVAIVFVEPGSIAPEGTATALLVPTSDEDAAHLASIRRAFGGAD